MSGEKILSALIELAERCEKAGTADQRALLKSASDHIWGFAFAPEGIDPEFWVKRWNRFNRMLDADAFESAAMMLMPDGCVWMVANCGVEDISGPDMSKASALCGPPYETAKGQDVEAATSALALCAASLRARARETGEYA